MRKLLRSVARARMERQGIQKINKKRGGTSYFAARWREYVRLPAITDTRKPHRKFTLRRLMAKLSRRRNRYA